MAPATKAGDVTGLGGNRSRSCGRAPFEPFAREATACLTGGPEAAARAPQFGHCGGPSTDAPDAGNVVLQDGQVTGLAMGDLGTAGAEPYRSRTARKNLTSILCLASGLS